MRLWTRRSRADGATQTSAKQRELLHLTGVVPAQPGHRPWLHLGNPRVSSCHVCHVRSARTRIETRGIPAETLQPAKRLIPPPTRPAAVGRAPAQAKTQEHGKRTPDIVSGEK